MTSSKGYNIIWRENIRAHPNDGVAGTGLEAYRREQTSVQLDQEHIADATAKGGTVFYGGESHQGEGFFMPPTIVTGATRDMAVATEETFGPLAPLFKFDDVDEVIELANDTIFGLASYFYAKDLSRVYKVAEALEYGIVGQAARKHRKKHNSAAPKVTLHQLAQETRTRLLQQLKTAEKAAFPWLQ